MNYDVVVIGSGLSGLMAAASAAKEKKRVLVVGRGMGIITIFTGTIDVLGYWPIQDDTPLSSPLDGIARLIKKDPDHPYAKVGIDGVKQGIYFFTETVKKGGVEYVGDPSENILIPTAVGTVKPTCIVSSSMVGGDLRVNKDVMICGFGGLKDFYPTYMAHNISTLSIKGQPIPRFRSRVLSVNVGSIRSGLNCLTLAKRLEDGRLIRAITEEVYSHLRKGERVAFPAVLGINNSREIHRELERSLGVPVFETPTLPPSVPGYRLFRALEGALRELGVHMLVGYDVYGPKTFGRRIGEVSIAMGKSEKRVSADAFVLATGGLVGKGITSSYAGFSEPIFDLPVSAPRKRADWFRKSLFDTAGHPINRAGIKVDDSLRPTDKKGDPIFDNLFICGTQLFGFDALREKSGGGVAVSSGYKAGIEASRIKT
jgi:glycerol-3-phosphate dehydrogenase subunit B